MCVCIYVYIYIYFMCVCVCVCVYMYIYIYIYILYVYLMTVLEHHNNVKEPNLPYNLSIAGRRIIAWLPFPKVLVLSEIHTALSWI